MEKHKRMSITLPISMVNELSEVAKELNDKKSHIIAKALTLYFDELDTKIADKRYKEYLDKHEETINLEDIDI